MGKVYNVTAFWDREPKLLVADGVDVPGLRRWHFVYAVSFQASTFDNTTENQLAEKWVGILAYHTSRIIMSQMLHQQSFNLMPWTGPDKGLRLCPGQFYIYTAKVQV